MHARAPCKSGTHLRPDLLHDAHELVPHDVAALHPGHAAQVQVQVGAADGGGRDAHHRVVLHVWVWVHSGVGMVGERRAQSCTSGSARADHRVHQGGQHVKACMSQVGSCAATGSQQVGLSAVHGRRRGEDLTNIRSVR